MENKRAFIISGICFLISIVLIAGYVRIRENEMTSQFGEKVFVLSAFTKDDRAIPEYSLIRAEEVSMVPMFKKFVQPSAVWIASDDEASVKQALGQVVGKSAFVPLYPGEQITLTKLISQDFKPFLDRQIEKNKRALTLNITPFAGVGRLIRPGDRVDILATPHYEMKGNTIFEVKTFLQNIPVLATGKHIQNDVPTRVSADVMDFLEEQFEADKRKDWSGGGRERLATGRPADDYSTLTLQVTPEEAKKLLFLTHTYGTGRIYYVLRNSADQEVAALETTLLDDILGPDSDYGRSFRKPPRIDPPKPKFYDSVGGKAVPIY